MEFFMDHNKTTSYTPGRPRKRRPKPKPSGPVLLAPAGGHLEIIPLGGMGEIGKNMFVFRFQDEILVIDGGLAFPDEHMLGVDLLIPRIDYLIQNADKIKGWVLTHGHEDHIGALPYLFSQLPKVPVYGARLTLGLVKGKLEEFGFRIGDFNFREV
ncbi:MBL fold metallo-hydrolase, partial [Helicobacter pylori]|nr:MBL fold metallo-hydrolase [Helicobacter pylori]MWR36369.1 MBL fold metallo-hydrolase [Helicobacter pylori]